MHKPISLVEIVDRINEMEQEGEFFTESKRLVTARTLLQFFDGSRNYLGFYLPHFDFQNGGRLFSGERLYTQLGINTVVSLEISRALIMLAGGEPQVQSVLGEINQRLVTKSYVKDGCISGEGAHNLLAFWRYLLVSDWPDQDAYLKRFILLLKSNRDGSGRWKRFPFYYTLMVLLETPTLDARSELEYALKACEVSLPFISITEPYRQRRKIILKRCLQTTSIPQLSYLTLGV